MGGKLYFKFEGDVEIHDNGSEALEQGGGVYLGSAVELTFNNNATKKIYSNTAKQGGGICVQGSSHAFNNIRGLEIFSNTALEEGGGICATSSFAFNEPCTIRDNAAGAAGGGMYLMCGTVIKAIDYDCEYEFTNTTIIRNRAGTYGGGIGAVMCGLTLNNCIVGGSSNDKNTAGTNGGGVCVDEYASLNVNGGNIDYNVATDNGGGLYLHTPGEINITGTSSQKVSISHNEASSHRGGGIFCAEGNIKAKYVTISHNNAPYGGGGMALLSEESIIDMENSEIIYNTSNESNPASNKGGGGILFMAEFPNTPIDEGGEVNSEHSQQFPFYTYYENSLSQQLYRAEELAAVGINSGTTITSLGWYVEENPDALTQRNSVTIYILEGSDTMTSPPTPTQVFSGNITNIPTTPGWLTVNTTSYTYNGGHLVIVVVCNDGNYYDAITWKAHPTDFPALFYAYRDDSPYSITDSPVNSAQARSNTQFNGSIVIGGYAEEDSTVPPHLLKNTIISNNQTIGNGGGIMIEGRNLTITGSTIGGANNANQAANGGGIYIGSNDTVQMTTQMTGTNNTVTHNTASTHGGGIYKLGTLKVQGEIYVTDNESGTAKAVEEENVYIPVNSADDQTILITGELNCGSKIGVTKTKRWKTKANVTNASATDTVPEYGTQGEHVYERDDNFKQVRTPIAKVSSNENQCWALYAFAKNNFFDDKDMYGVWSMNYHKTNSANDYNDQTDYFIETWRCYASNANADWSEDGSGYQVKSAKGLAYLSKHVNDINVNGGPNNFYHFDGSNYYNISINQIADIDLSPHYWEPIGLHTTTLGCENKIYPFSGAYDGHGHTITGAISILPVQAMGLFGYVMNGTVKRTFSIDCDFTLTRDTILNVLPPGTIVDEDSFMSGSNCNGLGGIVGFLHARTTSLTSGTTTAMLDRCEAHGKLTQYFVSTPYTSSSSKAGEWYADASAIIGGLVGAVASYGSGGYRSASLTGITNSFAVTDITGTKAYMGGLVGGMDVKGGNSSNKGIYNLYNSYSKANLTVPTGGTCSVGSLVGVANVGSYSQCNINNCYTHNAGEKLVGKTAKGSITCSNLYAPQGYSVGEGYVSKYDPTIGADQLGYMYADNVVEGTGTVLFELLNSNAETLNGNATATENTPGYRTYDRWARPALAYYVDNGSKAVSIERPINGDLPVLMMDNYGGADNKVGQGGFRAVSTVSVQNEGNNGNFNGYVLQYSGPTRDETGNTPSYTSCPEIDGMLARSTASDSHFIYGDVSEAPSLNIMANRISIYEHAAITQTGTLGGFDKTHVSITFDNSAGGLANASTLNINNLPAQFLPRNWHLLSTPLNNAPIGFNYYLADGTTNTNVATGWTSGDNGTYANNPWQNGGTAEPGSHGGTEFSWLENTDNAGRKRYWMTGWTGSLSNTGGGYANIDLNDVNIGWKDGYFPSTFDATLHRFSIGCIMAADENNRYPYGMDFYSWTEPNYHYINFKRNGPNHWHSDPNANGEHEHLGYKPEKASNYASPQENVNEEILLTGKGYFASIAEKTLLQSSGQLGTNTKTIGVTCSTYPNTVPLETGWNLVGNPFHAYLDFDQLCTDNSGKITEDRYLVYNADGFNSTDSDENSGHYGNGFSYYVKSGSAGGAYAHRYLHPHQGFFVKVGSGPKLNFTESQTVLRSQIGTSGSYRDDSRPAYPLVNLFLTSDKGCSDVCVVEFNRPEWGGATKLRDMYSGNGLFYAFHDNKNYAALFATPDAERIPLKFEPKDEAGDTYTLSWNTQNGNFHKLYLVDNITGVQYDMLRNSSYSFSGKKGDYWSRFYITFDVTGIEEEEEDDDTTGTASTSFAFFDGSEWVVTNSSHGPAQLDLIDLQGRVLHSATLAEGQARIGLPDVAKGMYLMRLSNNKGTQVQKVIVR